jgi:hypothetical protein
MINKTEQTYIDKSSWPDGPWKTEPDRVSWVDPETGYPCLIRRAGANLGHLCGAGANLGYLCGYVAVEKGHPFYEQAYSDNDYEVDTSLEVHGGITFANPCDGDTITGICHLTKDEDKAWWFGFD